MTPDDPRHGTGAGYLAHFAAGHPHACAACAAGRSRERKRVQLAHLAGHRMSYTAEEVDEVLAPWLALGLSPNAVIVASGLGPHRSGAVLRGNPVRRATYRAIASVTEDSLDGNSLVWAHLTRQRIGSLQVAGYTLDSMPIAARGRWRNQDRVLVDTARAIRDFYLDHHERPGTHPQNAARALNQGHRPPAAWDDPGTLAWPLGWTEPLPEAEADDLDPVIVERILAGAWRLRATPAERLETVRRWRLLGHSDYSLEKKTGWNIARDFRVHAPKTDEEVAA